MEYLKSELALNFINMSRHYRKEGRREFCGFCDAIKTVFIQLIWSFVTNVLVKFIVFVWREKQSLQPFFASREWKIKHSTHSWGFQLNKNGY